MLTLAWGGKRNRPGQTERSSKWWHRVKKIKQLNFKGGELMTPLTPGINCEDIKRIWWFSQTWILSEPWDWVAVFVCVPDQDLLSVMSIRTNIPHWRTRLKQWLSENVSSRTLWCLASRLLQTEGKMSLFVYSHKRFSQRFNVNGVFHHKSMFTVCWCLLLVCLLSCKSRLLYFQSAQ